MNRSRFIVVAAVLERDGQLLIGQRRTGDRHGLKWEFPGGKVEPGEAPKEALARELREELGIEARIDEEIVRYEYQYPQRRPILLIFHRVREWAGELDALQFEQIKWEAPRRLPTYDFLDGDIDFVKRLARGEF